ncbi:MAG TPA: UDP-2,3-diacylglucosamine diphosphatase LpxI [Candidatus Nitrosotalea sp.]|nr:UDP-2,3-diacylglucosamine diphosphatase LpxI [Candidatus Nitrosotalea sp.]
MERSLGLMAGAGTLPGHAAAEAKRRGWRVAAFAFEEAPGLSEAADDLIPSTITDIQAVLAGLTAHRVEAAVFVGKFWKSSAFSQYDQADAAARGLARGGLSDAALTQTVVATLESMGIEVLDQREFLAPWLLSAGTLTTRGPSSAEWDEIREGFRLASRLAADGIGQTVVRARGVTVAVEAAEGTDETIRRGGRLAGPGAVVVKTVADSHDYRFDIPTVGAATLEAMRDGGATALAVPAGHVLLLDREQVVLLADQAGITVVSVDGAA